MNKCKKLISRNPKTGVTIRCGAVSRTNYPYGRKWQLKARMLKGNTKVVLRKARTRTKGVVTYIIPHHPECPRCNPPRLRRGR